MEVTEVIKSLREVANELRDEKWGYEAKICRVAADRLAKSEGEIERLKHILDCYALQYGTVKDQQKVIDEANGEFAREIFEEIEEMLGGLMREYNKGSRFSDADVVRYVYYLETELKKRYTEDQK